MFTMRFAGVLVSASLAVALSGCGGETVTGANRPEPLVANLTDPAAVVSTFAASLERRDIDVYSALLDPAPVGDPNSFRYYPALTDFPWLPDSWDRDTELNRIAHLCDRTFVSEVTREIVDRIDIDADVLSVEELATSELAVRSTYRAEVLWAAARGASVDVELEFHLARDRDGFLRIRSIYETLPSGRSSGDEPGIAAMSWTQLKQMFF